MFLKHSSLLAAAVMVTLFVASGAYGVETDPVVARVNGHDVRLGDVENARNLLPSKMQGAPLRDVYPVLMESLINSRLAADKAVKLGFNKTPEYLHRMARISDQILERILLARHIEQNLTDVDIEKRYDQVVERAQTQSEIHARHILVKNEDHAKALIELLKDGADFATLATQQSQGPSKSRGGDLGWFGPGKMVKAFEEAAIAIPSGAFSGAPVKTQFGWHVIKVEERRAVAIPSYQDVREILANELSAELGQKFMEQLRAEASIEKKSFEEIVKALQDQTE